MRGIFRRGMAVLMMCMLMLSMTASAEHEDPLIINPLSAPLSREETEQMVAEARKAFLQRQGLKDELASEIRIMHEVVPAYDYPTEEREFYVLSHKGMTMRFFMETIGKPDEKGLYPLYIALHGGGGGPEEINND